MKIAEAPVHAINWALPCIQRALLFSICTVFLVACDNGTANKRDNSGLNQRQLSIIHRAIDDYRSEHGDFPSSLEDLTRRGGNPPPSEAPYLFEIPLDPWGNDYVYKEGLELRSLGPDGELNTDDDTVTLLR